MTLTLLISPFDHERINDTDPFDPERINDTDPFDPDPFDPKYTDPDGRVPLLIPVFIFLAKEIASEAVEQATGVPMPTVKNLGKSVAKELTKKQVSRQLRRTSRAKDIKSRTGTRNDGNASFVVQQMRQKQTIWTQLFQK